MSMIPRHRHTLSQISQESGVTLRFLEELAAIFITGALTGECQDPVSTAEFACSCLYFSYGIMSKEVLKSWDISSNTVELAVKLMAENKLAPKFLLDSQSRAQFRSALARDRIFDDSAEFDYLSEIRSIFSGKICYSELKPKESVTTQITSMSRDS